MRYLLPIFLFLVSPVFSQTLSPESRVSLLTISPGQELYSTFGHSAIRIYDPVNLIDVNYNYGTFDFNQPGFYVKFMRGYLDYMITSYEARIEMGFYDRENRLITEQVLDLSLAQKQKMFDFLENNLKPENRQYRYKFFTDNCSTRLRDVLLDASGDSLQFDTAYNGETSFREWISLYSEQNNLDWAKFGMNLAVGLDSDKETGWSDAMFLPDNLMKALDQAQIMTDEGLKPVVISKRDLNQITVEETKSWFTPFAVFLVLMLLVVVYTMYQIRFNNHNILFDKTFFSVLGLAGWVLLLLWYGTDHGVTQYNPNLVWASPLLFPAIFYLKKWGRVSIMIYLIVLLVGLVYFMTMSQFKFPVEIIFIAIAILFRLYFLFKIKQIGFRKA